MDHPHLVKLFGIVTSNPICIVTEFMEHKSLLDYLRKYKSLVDYPETLLNMSKQVRCVCFGLTKYIMFFCRYFLCSRVFIYQDFISCSILSYIFSE